MVRLTCQTVNVPVALRMWYTLEDKGLCVEHALLLVDVAVRHVHDGDISSAIKVTEGYAREYCLHVRVVKLEAL